MRTILREKCITDIFSLKNYIEYYRTLSDSEIETSNWAYSDKALTLSKLIPIYLMSPEDMVTVINKEKVSTTNISSIFKYRDCLDLLKIDVQGYELEVIKGLGEVRPLIIESEVSYVPLYQDSATFFELGKELYDMGYIMFHSSFRCIQSPILLPFTKKHVNQIPVHGDAWFIPDWTRKKGIDIIKHREKKWKAIMLLYGMESIFDYAISEIKNT